MTSVLNAVRRECAIKFKRLEKLISMLKEHYESYKNLFREWYHTTHPKNEEATENFHVLLGYHWDEMSSIDRAKAEGYEDGYHEAILGKGIK